MRNNPRGGRLRRGCVSCRRKHLKCDDAQPSCTRCSKTGAECVREYIRFKVQGDSRQASSQQGQTRETSVSAPQPPPAQRNALEFIEESGAPSSETSSATNHDDGGEASHPNIVNVIPESEGQDKESHEPHGLVGAGLQEDEAEPASSASTYQSLPEFSSLPEESLLAIHPSHAHAQAVSSPESYNHDVTPIVHTSLYESSNTSFLRLPTIEEAIASFQDSTPTDNSPPPFFRNVSLWPLQDPVEAKLLRYYIDNVSRRFDLCDPERHFALVVPCRAAFCPPLLDAALALSARCLSRTTEFDAFISNRYYQRCLNSLIPTLGNPEALMNQDLFAAIVLLRTLEEIEVPLSGADSTTHLFGSHLFASVSASSPDNSSLEPSGLTGLRRACFMVAFRQEIYTAFVSQRPVITTFCPYDVSRSLDEPGSDSTWTNRILLHLVDTLDFCFGGEATTLDQSRKKFTELCSYADEWFSKKPSSFSTMFRQKSTGITIAQEIWIISDAAATGLLNYHLLRILLLSFDPNAPRVGPSRARFFRKQNEQVKEEVKTLIGLATGNFQCAPHSVLAGMGIAMAGDRFEERWEQEELLKFLKNTESIHAWSTIAAQRHLIEAWGWDTDMT